jgi:predicted nucleic acid-binding protein
VRFWDSSAVVPLLVSEEATSRSRGLYEEDAALVAWWGTPVECISAVARLERDGDLEEAEVELAAARLRSLAGHWTEVVPSEPVRRSATRLLRVHALRAGDALQLAAAITFAAGDQESLDVVTFDERLARAAAREGFPVVSR